MESLPHNYYAEQAVLAAILLDDSVLDSISPPLQKRHFYRTSHQLLFAAMLELHKAGAPIDPASLRLTASPEIYEKLGGDRALERLLDGFPRSVNAKYYAKIVYEVALKRDFLTDVVPIAQNGMPPASLARALRGVADTLDTTLEAESPMLSIGLKEAVESDHGEPPWIINGWMAAGDLILFAAEPKIGKSFVALDVALSAASGLPVLGIMDVPRPLRVLYLDEENPGQLARKRIAQMIRGRSLSVEIPVDYLNRNHLNLDDDAVHRRLLLHVERTKPDLIVLDSLIRFHRRAENDNSEMSAFFEDRIRPLQAWGAAVLVLHHLSKPSKEREGDLMNRARGASDIPAVADGLWGLSGDRKTAARTLEHGFCRWEETNPPLSLKYERAEDHSWCRLDASEEADDIEARMIALLRESKEEGRLRDGLVQFAVSSGYKAPQKAVTRALGHLSHAGTVVKARDGRGMRYWLTGFAPRTLPGEDTAPEDGAAGDKP